MTPSQKPLKGRRALVTGATSGIGRGIAQALAREGAAVAISGMGEAGEIERLRAELAAESGAAAFYHAADLAAPGGGGGLARAAEASLGGIDILVNNAGIQFVAPVEEFPEERWLAVQHVVLTSSFESIKQALPGMKARGWGRIVNISSAHGLVASPFKSAYVAAKHGVVGLTRSVALEVAESGVTCNAVCPGYVRTPLVEAQIATQAKAHGITPERAAREIILAVQPTKRFVEIDEIAALVVFLCGDMARSITGAALPIDGGWTAR